VVECLPSKYETLRSNPSTEKKKKKIYHASKIKRQGRLQNKKVVALNAEKLKQIP
jgi:hypothetical protein